MSQQKSKADAVGVAQASAPSHTRSVSGAHTSNSIPNSTPAVKVEVKHLKRQVAHLTHLVRLLADRTALEISEGQDDSLAWIQAELRQLEVSKLTCLCLGRQVETKIRPACASADRSDRITRVIEVQRLDDGDLSEEEAREIADRRLKTESINQVRLSAEAQAGWYFTGTQRVNGNRVQVIYDR